MGTEVLKSYDSLQCELDQVKLSLRDLDENIKKLIGRDPSENQNRTGVKRSGTNHGEDNRNRGRTHINTNNNRNKTNFENDEPSAKKRNVESNVFKRLSDRPVKHYDEENPELHGKLISKVIVTPKELPSRQDVMNAQSADEKSKARNRRMFGALLGTLQKFRQEETKLKPKEEKRAQVEKKLEEQQIKEREELKKERQDLFYSRKKKQAEIRMIELKMTRMKEHSDWEEKQKPLMNFIQTKAKPHIYYLPKVLNEQNKKLLDTCKTNIEKMIDKKRQGVFDELTAIENRMKKNFEKHQISITEDEKHEEEIMDHEELHEEQDENEDNANLISSNVKTEEIISDHSQDQNNQSKEDSTVIEDTCQEIKEKSEEIQEESIENVKVSQENVEENKNINENDNQTNDTQ